MFTQATEKGRKHHAAQHSRLGPRQTWGALAPQQIWGTLAPPQSWGALAP